MIMNMNEKGRQTKLLAAIAVLAMVVCALAVVIPSDNVEGVSTDIVDAPDIESVADAAALVKAINDDTTSIVVDKAIEVTDSNPVILDQNQTLWITGEGKITIGANSVLTIAGTVYCNAGTSDSDPGIINNGSVTLADTGVIYSVSAVGATSTPVAVNAFFTSIDDAVEDGYLHIYAGNVNTLAPFVVENDYTGEIDGKLIYTYGDMSISGNVNLSGIGLVAGGVDDGMNGNLTIAENAVVVAESVTVKSSSTITYNGIVIDIPAGTTASYSNGVYNITGTPVAVNDEVYKELFESANGLYAYAGILGLKGTDVTVKQVNPALGEAWSTTDFPDNTKVKGDYDFGEDPTYYFLAPKSGGSVTITITPAGEGATDTVYKFNFNINGNAAVADTDDDYNAAVEDETVTEITVGSGVTLGTSGTYTAPGKIINVALGQLPQNTTLAEGTIFNFGDVTDAVSDKTITFGTGEDAASVSLSGFTGNDVTIKQGSVEISGTNLSGTITVTGDVVITELADQSTGSSTDGLTLVSDDTGLKTVTYDDDLAINNGGLTLGAEAGTPVSLEAESNQNIALNGDITIYAGSSLTVNSITGTGKIIVKAGATLAYNKVSDSITINADDGAIIKIEGGQGTENVISTDMTVTGDVYLSQNTTIKEGVTVTVTRNSTLHLMAFDLINNGNIVVDRNGTIVSDNGGSIVMMTSGTIQNSGIIGGSKPVDIENGASSQLNQSVSIQGIDGISFKMVRTGTGADRVYNMYVSGDIGRVSGVTTGTLALNSVGINADMTIKSNVILNVTGTVAVSKDVTFTFGGNIMNVTGTFKLNEGASAVINAPVSGPITAVTGKVATGNVVSGSQTVTFNGEYVDGEKPYYAGVTGITISVDRVNKYNEQLDETEVFQRMYVTGAMDLQNQVKEDTTGNTVTFSGDVYVIDTLTIPEDVKVTGGKFMVSEGGSVVAVNMDTTLSYNGAMYSVESTDATNDDVTYYYVDFATAMANIATADEQEIVLSGTYEITGTYTLAANQAIVNDDAQSGVTVGETGDITVELDADVQDTAFCQILGKVLVKEGVGYTPSANGNIYAVKAVDSETNDTTYSGFGVAMDEAQAGQTITVVGEAEYDGNLVIPNGVIVDVQQDVPLKVLGNVTVENGGKLILDSGADMTVGKTAGRDYTITVAGELDASEGGAVIGLTGASVDFYSTGTSTFPIGAANFTNVDVNAAYYDDADRVYTTLAAAVAYAETNALPTVYAVGTFSETGAIESDEVDIVIGLNSNVTLGDVTLNDAKISVSKPAAGNTADKAGQYTANVSGLSGAGDAAVTSTVSVSKTDATVESKVTLNAEGVNQYVLIISGLTGATTSSAGTVQFADGAELSISRDNALTIASGATLLVAEDEDLTISIVKDDPSNAGYFVNNGTIQLDGSLILSAASATIDSAVLPGTVNVSETGAIDANGNVTVTGDVTVATDGKFNVAGILSVGETPDYLGEAATGSVAGAVTLDATSGSNYVVVYAGASVADAVIGKDNSTEPETTAFQVNGLDLMTVYTFGNETLDTFQSVICELDDLEGYKYNTSGQPNGYVDLVWTAEGNTVPGATAIGEYAIVSTELAYRSADIVISVGTHITVTVDGIIVDNYYGYPLKIGTHTVSATVDPGYSGDVTITFNGQTVSNGGTIEITSEMLSTLDSIVLSVTGTLTQDSTVVVDGGSSGDSGMGLTDYLLIILVILIVVMAIMVAMRLMRS